LFSGTSAPVAARFSRALKIYSEGESQQMLAVGLSSQSLKPMKDLPVPVGWDHFGFAGFSKHGND
jgi:hypothetical protein